MTYQAPPPYGQPQTYGETQPRPGSGMAITALVLGVLALLTCWTVVGGILLGLVAVVLGIVALSKIKRGRASGKPMAIIGIITGALALLAAVALIAVGASILNSESGQNLQDCLADAGTDADAQAECQQEFQEELMD